MEGWIKLHRSITEHWLWNNQLYLRAWLYCLIRANHQATKCLIGADLVPLNRGEFITSRSRFAKDTGMSEQSVRTFWNLLKSDKMINQRSTNKLTMITICNYDKYQVAQPAGNRRINQPATTDKNVKEEIIKNIYSLYPTKCVVEGRALGKSRSHYAKINTLLKSHTEGELISIIKRYVLECKNTKTFMMNFGTFLNNLPDYDSPGEAPKDIKTFDYNSMNKPNWKPTQQ